MRKPTASRGDVRHKRAGGPAKRPSTRTTPAKAGMVTRPGHGRGKLLRLVFGNMDEGVVVFDADDKVAAFNHRFAELLQLEEGTIRLGLPWDEVIRAMAERGAYGPGDADAQLAARKAARREHFEVDEITLPDGTVLAIRRGRLPDGGFVSTFRDVTRRRRLAAELREAMESLRKLSDTQTAIVESSGDAILTLMSDGTIESANSMAGALFAHGGGNIVGRRITTLLPEFPFFQPGGGFPGAPPPLYQGEMMGVRSDGSRFPSDVVMTTAHSPAGDFYVINIRDTTGARTMQEELIQASKLATLGEMAAGMAHELNQPLNVIRMSADNAAMRLERGTAKQDYLMETLEGIGEQAAKLGKMILDLRIFARREERSEALRFTPTTVAAAACRLMRGQLHLDSIEIEESYCEPCRPVQGSGTQLEQVIINLIGNARDAILEQRAEGRTIPGRVIVAVSDAPGTDWVEITVEDNGGGIPEKVMDKIFNPFFTTKEVGKGTGLGLSISYGIVSSMKGRITARNMNDGARIKVRLPACAEESEESRKPVDSMEGQ